MKVRDRGGGPRRAIARVASYLREAFEGLGRRMTSRRARALATALALLLSNVLAAVCPVAAYAISFEPITVERVSEDEFEEPGFSWSIDFEDAVVGKLKDKGVPYRKLCPDAQDGERPIAFYEVGEKMPKGSLLFYSRLGYVKKSDWKEYNILKYAFQACKVNEGDELIGIETDDPEPTTTLFFVTEQGMCLNAYKNDIPTQGRVSAGVRGIALSEGDKVVFAGQIDGEGEIIVATDGNTYKKVIASQIDPMARYRKGVKIVDLGKGRKVSFADYVTVPYKLAVQMDDGSLVTADTEEDITIEDRTTKGKNFKLKKGCKAKAFWSLKYLK